MTLTVQQMLAIQDRYDVRFDNLDEVFHRSICADARFLVLLVRALEAGEPLTRDKVEGVFGPLNWKGERMRLSRRREPARIGI
jgi:hypothetical protein